MRDDRCRDETQRVRVISFGRILHRGAKENMYAHAFCTTGVAFDRSGRSAYHAYLIEMSTFAFAGAKKWRHKCWGIVPCRMKGIFMFTRRSSACELCVEGAAVSLREGAPDAVILDSEQDEQQRNGKQVSRDRARKTQE